MVARVKAEAIDGLYENMETSEGQKDVYRIAAARDREGKDIGQIRTIKSATGEVLMKDEYIRERWGQYFSWLMNEENPRVETDDRAPNQGMTSPVSEAEIERTLRGMKCGKMDEAAYQRENVRLLAAQLGDQVYKPDENNQELQQGN